MAGKRRFNFPSSEEVTIFEASVIFEWPFHMVCGSLDKLNVFSCHSRSFDAGGEPLLMTLKAKLRVLIRKWTLIIIQSILQFDDMDGRIIVSEIFA